MFSSTTNIHNPLPQLPSSSFQIPFTDAAAAGFFPFHNYNYLPPNYTTANINNAPPPPLKVKKVAARKDRHSKISTSQGLRDRRVRLSIGISREFFDLQDKLGFQTASNTIEWLLGKSKKDIQQLKNKSSSSSSNEGGDLKKVKMSQKDESAREFRAKKRERARERTREKSCVSDSNPNSGLTQLGPHNNITTNNNMMMMTSFLRVEEAIVSQRKTMMSPIGELKRV